MLSPVNIEDYNYLLPDEQVAKYPVSPRDNSKLLVYKNGQVNTSVFNQITAYLPKNAHLVFNNTRVIPARLYFRKESGALIEIFLLNPVSQNGVIDQAMEAQGSTSWQCMIGNKKKWKGSILEGDVLLNSNNIIVRAELINPENNTVNFSWAEENVSFAELVKAYGQMPLPPYLNRATEAEDEYTYQTVYSKKEGAVAAPTAGLHFTDEVLADLKVHGLETSYITLHVGAGTFQPVKVENALEHEMHSEQMVFKREFLEALLENHSCVIPVGTTSMRSLESLYWFGVLLLEEEGVENFRIPKLYPYKFANKKLPALKDSLKEILSFMDSRGLQTLIGDTEIFIFPGYNFRVCKGIITNFHQPKSTLLLLISALVGEKWKELYSYAQSENFRFLSYGDSSLLLP